MKKISLFKEFGKNLITRNTVTLLFSKLNKVRDKDLIIDFKGIDFISRSCADEYLKQKLSSIKNLNEINKSYNIKQMFDLVERSLKSDNKARTISNLQVYTL